MAKKILVIRNAYDTDAGGAEQYALNLCIVLKERGLQPLLMTRVPDLLKKATAAGITTKKGQWHRTQEWGKHYFLRLPWMVVWYAFILIRYRIDIVHPQGRDDFIFASIAAGLLGKPVVWTDHADLKYIMDLSVHPFPFLKSWTLFAARFARHIICVSNAEKDKIVAVSPPQLHQKLIVVHNGVFIPENIEPVSRSKDPLLVSNARLVPDKGVGELLEALAKIKNRQAKLWIVGSPSGNKEKYQSLAKSLGVDHRVSLLGYVTNPDSYIATGDIFVHASYHEALSLAIIEAAMLGKPIIATAVGGAPETITDRSSGLLVPPKDVPSLVQAINYMLEHSNEARSMGEAAQKRARDEFDFRKIVQNKIIPLYGV